MNIFVINSNTYSQRRHPSALKIAAQNKEMIGFLNENLIDIVKG
jgi:hypothetical protein